MKNWSFFPPLISYILHFHQEPLLQHSQVHPGKSYTHFHYYFVGSQLGNKVGITCFVQGIPGGFVGI